MRQDPEATFLAMDVGGTTVKQGLVNRNGQVLASRSFPTRSSRPQQALIDDMLAGLKKLTAEAPSGHEPLALALGMPGWLNQKEGFLLRAPNMPGWVNVPVTRILHEALGLPVHLENDANLYALGEWLGGAGRGLNNQITLTLGTGVGGGLILEGRIWNGSFASAAEIGHLPIGKTGARCGCGRRGCLETEASATGMVRLGRAWLTAGRATFYDGAPEELTPQTMHDLALRGDPMSLAVFRRAGRALGLALAATFNLLGLEGVVIGGGAAGALEFIQPHLRKTFTEHLITARAEEIRIVKAALGENAPLAGAAALLTQYGY